MDDESAVISALESRAEFLREEIRRMDAFLDELRKVERLMAYYKRHDTVESAAGQNDRRVSDVFAAVRRVLLTEPSFEARVGFVYERLPDDVKALIGGKDARVASEILRHRIRECGDEFGVEYDRGTVRLHDANQFWSAMRHEVNAPKLDETFAWGFTMEMCCSPAIPGQVTKRDAGWLLGMEHRSATIEPAGLPVLKPATLSPDV